MNTQPNLTNEPTLDPAGVSPAALDSAREHPWTTRAFAAVAVVLGLSALAYPWISTLAVQSLIAAFLVVTGLADIVTALRYDAWGTRSRVLTGLSGAFGTAAGVLLVLFPFAGVLTSTLFLCGAFLASGAMRVAVAVRARGARGRGWLAASGVMAIVLALLVTSGLPLSAFWLLGTLVGASLVFQGVALFALTATATASGPANDDSKTRVDRTTSSHDRGSTTRDALLGH